MLLMNSRGKEAVESRLSCPWESSRECREGPADHAFWPWPASWPPCIGWGQHRSSGRLPRSREHLGKVEGGTRCGGCRSSVNRGHPDPGLWPIVPGNSCCFKPLDDKTHPPFLTVSTTQCDKNQPSKMSLPGWKAWDGSFGSPDSPKGEKESFVCIVQAWAGGGPWEWCNNGARNVELITSNLARALCPWFWGGTTQRWYFREVSVRALSALRQRNSSSPWVRFVGPTTDGVAYSFTERSLEAHTPGVRSGVLSLRLSLPCLLPLPAAPGNSRIVAESAPSVFPVWSFLVRTSVMLDSGPPLIQYDLILTDFIYKNPISQQHSEVSGERELGWGQRGHCWPRSSGLPFQIQDSCHSKWGYGSWVTFRSPSQLWNKSSRVDIGDALLRSPGIPFTDSPCPSF